MRVTNKMLSNNFLSDMNKNLENLKTLQTQMTSGKNFKRPSDDPFNVARAMQMHTAIGANTQYNKNITNTINWLDTTDTALGQLGNVFQAVREKMVSAGDAAYGSDERQKIKDEINQRVGQISQILNTSFDGEYIFGGIKGTTKPTAVDEKYVVTQSNTNGGAMTVTGTPTSTIGTNYKITVTGVDGNGNITGVDYRIQQSNGTWPATGTAATVTGNSFTADGMNIKVDQNLATSSGDTYTFSTVGNNQLRYDENGTEIREFNDVISNVVTPVNWSGQQLTFNINGVDASITLGTFGAGSTINDVVNDINSKIDSYQTSTTPPVNLLQGKLIAQKTDDNKIRFVTMSNDSIAIKSTTLPATEFSSTSTLKSIPSIKLDMIKSDRQTEISQGVLVKYNVSASSVIKYGSNSGDNIAQLLQRIVNHLDGKDNNGDINVATANQKLTTDDLSDLDSAISQILKVRSQVGSMQNRMDSAKDQNEQSNYDMTDILSKTEDIDITEKTMEYATMQTVYLASLQTSAKVLQPTLMDYL